MKKIKNLKLYLLGGMIVTALASNPVVVHAEEEVLYEETNDDYTVNDTPEQTVPANTDTNKQVVTPTSDATPSLTSQPTEEPATVFNPNDTTIEPGDEKYNTGRTEIPDSVLTEAERKGLKPTPTPTPDTPVTPSDDKKENTTTTSTVTTQTTTVTPVTSIPKTGISPLENAVESVGFAALFYGLGYGALKVVLSRKFKNSKKRTK